MLSLNLKDKRLSQNKNCTCEEPAKLSIYGGNVGTYVRNGEHFRLMSYLYICICSFIFALSTR